MEYIVDSLTGKKENITKEGYVDGKCFKEANRKFSTYLQPVLEQNESAMEKNRMWLDLSQFIIEDLQWLLSLKRRQFWSYVVYSKDVQYLLASIIRKTPPYYIRKFYVLNEEIESTIQKIERLVFLILWRLSNDEESKLIFSKSGDCKIFHDFFLFSVPLILDVCLLYGFSNSTLLKAVISNAFEFAPNFSKDFEETTSYFLYVLKHLKQKFSTTVDNFETDEIKFFTLKHILFFLYDTVTSMQLFLNSYLPGCKFMCKNNSVNELIGFYSNVLPQMQNIFDDFKNVYPDEISSLTDLINDVRIEFLNIVKNLFSYIYSEAFKNPTEVEDIVNDFTILMINLSEEPTFFEDYLKIYPVTSEMHSFIDNYIVDTAKVNHILSLIPNNETRNPSNNSEKFLSNASNSSDTDSDHNLSVLLSQVKDILPEEDDSLIKSWLKNNNYDVERLIVGVLDGSLCLNSSNSDKYIKGNFNFDNFESKNSGYSNNILSESRKNKTWNQDIGKIEKESYSRWFHVSDQMYDDEYDDTYDENLSIAFREEEDGEKSRRSYMTMRQNRECDKRRQEKESEEEEDEDEEEQDGKFSINTNESKYRNEKRDVVGRGKGHGQSKNVLRNREYKEAHKSFIGNHNRKRQAKKKFNRGMIPI